MSKMYNCELRVFLLIDVKGGSHKNKNSMTLYWNALYIKRSVKIY